MSKNLLKLSHKVSLTFQNNRIVVMVEDSMGRSQFPIMYYPGENIAYDFPDSISEDQKKEVRRAFEMIYSSQIKEV